jgi:hypothetical protein
MSAKSRGDRGTAGQCYRDRHGGDGKCGAARQGGSRSRLDVGRWFERPVMPQCALAPIRTNNA